MSKGLLKIRIFLQLFYCLFLQREGNSVRRTKRTKERVLFCVLMSGSLTGERNEEGVKAVASGQSHWGQLLCSQSGRLRGHMSMLGRNIPGTSLHIVSAVIVSNRKLSNAQWVMCIKSNDCLNSLTLVSDCNWVLHYIICRVKLVASMTRKEDTNHLADWIAKSTNPHNLNVKFRVLFVRNPITG